METKFPAGGISQGMGQLFAVVSMLRRGCFYRHGTVFRRDFGKIEIAATILAQANILAVFQVQDNGHSHAHVAAGASLVAQRGHASFALVTQAIVMAQDGCRDFGAQFCNPFLEVRLNRLFKFERLQLNQNPHQFVHKSWQA